MSEVGSKGGMVRSLTSDLRHLSSDNQPARAWSAETIALHHVNPGSAQEQLLLGGLDALRRDLHAETAAETDHGMNDGGRVRRALDRMHKATVDLELIEGKAAQIKQARITGAEVVERKPDAQRLEAEHRKLGGIDIAKQRALGHFQLEARRVEIRLGEDALDDVDKVGASELQRRDIDRNRNTGPGLAVEAGLPQHGFAERDDEAAVL